MTLTDIIGRLLWVYMHPTEYDQYLPTMQELCSEIDRLPKAGLTRCYDQFVDAVFEAETVTEGSAAYELEYRSIESFWTLWTLPMPLELRHQARAGVISTLPQVITEELLEKEI